MIAGKKAECYVLTATVTMQAPQRGGRGGGFPHGRHGGFPLGEGMFLRTPEPDREPSSGDGSGRPPLLRIEGEYWLAEAAILPAGTSSPALPLLQQTVTAGPVLKELLDQLTKMKLIPLAGQATATVTRPSATRRSR